jgi:hypothetical protein
MSQEKSNSELVKELIDAFSQLKEKFEDPNRIYLEKSIKQLMENQNEMKEQISGLKKELLNPRTGVVVETIKNTEFREKIEERGDLGLDLLTEHKELIKWKNNINKAFWLMLTTVLGILAFLVTNNM